MIFSYLPPCLFNFCETTFLNGLAVTSSSNTDNSFRVKGVDSFQELVQGVVSVTDDKDRSSFSSVPNACVVQENLCYL